MTENTEIIRKKKNNKHETYINQKKKKTRLWDTMIIHKNINII